MGTTTFSGPVVSQNGFVGEFTGETGNVALTGTLGVSGAATFGATAVFNGVIGATGSITTASTLTVGATASFGGVIGATGGITTAKTLTVGATATFNGAVGATGTVTSTGGFVGAVTLPTYTVATVPGVTANARKLIYVSDGATGNPVVAFSDGTDWLRCDTLTAIAAS